MYGIVLPTLLLICSGIVNSKPNINVGEDVTETSSAIVATDSLTPTTVRPSIGLKNCSYKYVEAIYLEFLVCISSTEWNTEVFNPTPNGFTIFKEYCKKISFENCLQNASSKFSECIEDRDNEVILQYQRFYCKSIYSWLSLWCQDEGSRMTTFYAEGGPFCFSRDKGEGTKRCVRLYGYQHLNKTCPFITQTLKCFLSVLHDCHLSQTAIHLYESSHDAFFEEASCSKYRLN